MPETKVQRHAALVRFTHWITAVCFFALLLSGIEVLISHPRFYWGEAGNSSTEPLFKIPIPASRASVPTGYGYTLPDQNGWSRRLHFQAAWGAVLTGLLYGIYGVVTGHFRRNLFPASSDLTWSSLLRIAPQEQNYNVLQRLTYLVVIFGLFPLMIWTGLAMSPAIAAAFPTTVTLLGGQQSARTIHFFVTLTLALFVVVHVGMVITAGFRNRVGAMIIGSAGKEIG